MEKRRMNGNLEESIVIVEQHLNGELSQSQASQEEQAKRRSVSGTLFMKMKVRLDFYQIKRIEITQKD